MKPQSKKLIDHFTAGGSITRDDAFRLFGIQNLTARLSEMTDSGFDIIRSTEKVVRANGQKMRVTHWKFRHVFNAGDMVKVTEDAGLFTSLKGKVGIVRAIDRYGATLTLDFPGIGMRRVSLRRLSPVNRLAPGTRVEIIAGHLVVGSYVPEGDSYLLLTPDPNLTIAASASLVYEPED